MENYPYLEQNGQMCIIKPTNYDQKNKEISKADGLL